MNRLTKGRGLIGKFLPDAIVKVVKSPTGSSDITLTIDQCKTNYLKLGGTPGGPFNVIFSLGIQNFYVIWNASGYTATLKCVTGDIVTIVDGAMGIYYCNGVGMYALTGQSGTAVTLNGVQTLTAKTLTTPIIASLYQDAGATKLMTVPNVASDTLAVIGASQTLALKTLTTPVIAAIYQDAAKLQLMTLPNSASDTLVALAATQTLTNKTLTSPAVVQKTASHDYAAGVVDWTLSASERAAAIISVTNASGPVNAILNIDTPNFYMVDNQSGQALTIKNAANGSIAIASTKRAIVYNNGTAIVRITADA